MITFLPYADFKRSAKVLDRLRLGKQRLETLWLLQWLGDVAYRNYPLVRMWRSHTNLLVEYGKAMCLEWMDRGYDDNLYDEILAFQVRKTEVNPSWLGDERLHSSHRGRLLAKNPKWYKQFGWTDEPRKTYFWPIISLF